MNDDPGLSDRAIVSILVIVVIVIAVTLIAGGQTGSILNTSTGNI